MNFWAGSGEKPIEPAVPTVSALPRAVRIAEIDGDVGFHGEAPMIGEFLPAIPGQRFVEILWGGG